MQRGGEGVLNCAVASAAAGSVEAWCGRLEIKQLCLFVPETSN